MELHEVNSLLEKYWQAETSLEEEQQLRDFFASGQVPTSLKAAGDLFAYFQAEKGNSLGQQFESTVTKQLRQRQGGKVVTMIGWGNIAKIAAGIAVVVAATFLVRQEIQRKYPEQAADTFSDPQLAFEETKRALQMISNTFGKAKKEAGKVQMLNEAEKKVQQKKEEEKINI